MSLYRCAHCLDLRFVAVAGTDCVRPCRQCNARAFERWQAGEYLATGVSRPAAPDPEPPGEEHEPVDVPAAIASIREHFGAG